MVPKNRDLVPDLFSSEFKIIKINHSFVIDQIRYSFQTEFCTVFRIGSRSRKFSFVGDWI